MMETSSRKDLMQRNKSQAGSTHIVIIVIFVVALIGTLGFIFWNNFLKETSVTNTATDNSQATKTEDKKEIAKDPYDGWKTYTSITPSNLSFKYPSDWEFAPPTKEFANTIGGKSLTLGLQSKKPKVESVNGGPVTTNQFICVTLTEYTGNWQYSNETYSNELSSETLSIANTSTFLNTYSDATLGRNNKPMGNIMRLITNPPSSRGQSYIDTRDDYRVEVTAQYNCIQGGEGIEDLNADFDAQPDTMAAKLIMKSVQF